MTDQPTAPATDDTPANEEELMDLFIASGPSWWSNEAWKAWWKQDEPEVALDGPPRV